MTKLAIVVCAYNMARELPRTVYTLSRQFQRGVDDLDYEITVIDNGSTVPLNEDSLKNIAPNLRLHRIAAARPSPVSAINQVVAGLDYDLLGLWVDGARMASPGLLRHALEAHATDASRLIGTIAFHLGPDVQMRSTQSGYNQEVEDALLAGVRWQDDGYSLFDISVLAGSSAEGWFGCVAESNAIFIKRSCWDELGGFDERFQANGGGLANLDLWKRAISLFARGPLMLLGEATFHQVHGGAATSGDDADRMKMHAEYVSIRGEPFTVPDYTPMFVGDLDERRLKAARPASGPRRRVHSVGDRPFSVGVPPDLLASIQSGTLRTDYKGLRYCKNPFDQALYLRLLSRLEPKTIIEIGVSEGGSSIWFRDQCNALGLEQTRIIGIDISRPNVSFETFEFFVGDSTRPEQTFPSVIADAPHPWLIIEDSAHTYESVREVLSYFSKYMLRGDYLVVEDGVVADLADDVYRRYEDGPNRAVSEFLIKNAGGFEIDRELCDFFGRNVTYCPNGWLKRT